MCSALFIIAAKYSFLLCLIPTTALRSLYFYSLFLFVFPSTLPSYLFLLPLALLPLFTLSLSLPPLSSFSRFLDSFLSFPPSSLPPFVHLRETPIMIYFAHEFFRSLPRVQISDAHYVRNQWRAHPRNTSGSRERRCSSWFGFLVRFRGYARCGMVTMVRGGCRCGFWAGHGGFDAPKYAINAHIISILEISIIIVSRMCIAINTDIVLYGVIMQPALSVTH